MPRYAAAAGVRNSNGSTNDPQVAITDPFILIFAPSGQVASVPGPSGVAGSSHDFTGLYRNWWNTFSQTPLAWHRNEIVMSMRNTPSTVGTDWGFAWQPYGQDAGARVNDINYNYASNVNMSEDAMFDGHNWKIVLWSVGGDRNLWAFKRMTGGGVFYTGTFSSAYQVLACYGLYTGLDPVRTGDQGGAGAPFGWRPRSGIVGTPPHDVISSPSFESAIGNLVNAGGIRNQITNISALSYGINDMLEHQGTVYVAMQHSLIGLRFGSKGQYIYSEALFNDSGTGALPTLPKASTYSSRLTKALTGGSKPRSLATKDNEVFMLDNDGKVHVVKPNTIQQVADLSQLGTPWSSGVFGGAISAEIDAYVGTGFRRHLLVNFNGQLHAFLNFQSNFRKAKGVVDASVNTGRGILWATSFDGRNWTDFSEHLPASGFHSPSGGGVTAGEGGVQVTNWRSFTSPYLFSGFTGQGAIPIPGASGDDFPENYGNVGIGAADKTINVEPAQPSGFRQLDIPLWSSGNLIDPLNTSFNALNVPLAVGSISGHLFPTFIKYPAGFGFQHPTSGGPLPEAQGGIFKPSGVGPSGYDYTGCRNYHISGFVDHQSRKLKLCFSEDFVDGGALTFELNRASGWNRTNYIPNSKQLNGYVPIMLYDPEVIIPSGGVLDPNPVIDEVDKTLTLKYKLYDWPFWDDVDVISEYSLDYGQSWSFIRRQKQLSTGTLQTDPSGVNGVEHSLVWRYSDPADSPHPLSKNVWQPHVQLRLRAVDPNFDPQGGFV